MTNVNYIAIVPPANLVHSIYDFYVEQQSWVSAQLQNNNQYLASPRTPALTPSPLTLTPRRKNSHLRRRRSSSSTKPHVNLDLRTRLTYLSRRSPIHSRHLRRQRRRSTHTPSSSTTAKSVRRRTSTSLSTRTASPPRTPPRETLSPTPAPPNNTASAGMALLAMYGDMVKDRMQSCMRLEEMVRDSRSKDLFAVSLF